MDATRSPLRDWRAEAVLERLHREADRQRPSLIRPFLRQIPAVLAGRGVSFDPDTAGFYDDKYIPISREQGQLLYLLVRAIDARSVVEFGTSFGISTIYLACAVRDNGGGRVVGSELLCSKAARARGHLDEAGVADLVEIREGDARDTLRNLAPPVDLALIDGFPTLALEVLRVIEPSLRRGAVVLVDDVKIFKRDLDAVERYVSDPANGYRAMSLDLGAGFTLAVRTA